ncbi:RNA-directed DNA polymerase [Halocynthiibacter styelae]|uniref:RNA-directed DNA polymerase n=1 Tax=Halocynthiibacter styelae TaxID=2761955 RepID=A0A8J7IWK5_9RHOB|nr:RNA-directed DNA polymerase [Paenihalocynthiibacter styelae]MBI1493180.1 RNA-directed DNA polymerase [Paenihalocynthiibacter styelae]
MVFKANILPLDEIRISDEYDRSVKGINFSICREKTAYIKATSDWLVRTDITRFYPSIYTHSIPWAAYGKERVKSGMGCYKGSFVDQMDVLVRACNRNRTIGIPIGPETSRIVVDPNYKELLLAMLLLQEDQCAARQYLLEKRLLKKAKRESRKNKGFVQFYL